jgi:hypothetical protein
VQARARGFLLVALATFATSCGFPVDCTNSLKVLGEGCPMTFDGTLEDLPRCDVPGGTVSGRTCGGLHELAAANLPHRRCNYDAVTHRLVGARLLETAVTYCGAAGREETAGRQLSAECRDAPTTVTLNCAAGGGGTFF